MKTKHFFLFLLCLITSLSMGQDQNSNVKRASKKGIPKYQKRNQYYNQSRGLDSPNAPQNYTAYRAKIYRSEKKKAASNGNSNSRSNSGNWKFNGPSTFQEFNSIGRVNRIGFHPTDINKIYVASAGGGLWYTADHGITWEPLTDHIPNMNLSGVVIDQYDPDVLYILTGDGDGCCGGAKTLDLRKYSTGVLKSYDHGITWEKTGLEFEQEDQVNAYNLTSHPLNEGIIFASTSAGLYRTSNHGITWNNVLPAYIFEVAFKPDDYNIMYAVDKEQFYKSTNGGVTWNITTTIPKLSNEATRMTMATCENDVERVYLYTAPRHDSLEVHRGLFLSDDAGFSFIKIDSTSNLDGGKQGRYDLAVACSNVNSDQILIGKVRGYKSTNTGDSLYQVKGFHADIHQFNVNPLAPERIYMANDGGLYYSDSFGDTDSWVYMSEYLEITQYYRISVGQNNPHMVIGGSQDNGTHLDVNIGANYTKVYHKDGMDCMIHPTNDSLIILSSQDGDFEFSDEMADTTYHLIDENDVPEDVQNAWVTPFAWDPVDPDNIYIGYEPIYRSFDGGATFNAIPDTVGGNHFLHVGTDNTSRLYASDSYTINNKKEYHIHRSNNNGTSWTPIHQNMVDSLVFIRKSGVATNPDDADEIWITLVGFDAGNKVFRSINAGQDWTNETGSLPNIPVNCIVYQDTDGSPSGAVYIGTDIGVYYRDDNLGDWIHFSNYLAAVEVSDLDIQYGSQTLYAGTHGRGIWTSNLYSNCPQSYLLTPTTILPNKDYFFQAENSISLYDYTVEGLGSNMKLRAGDYILITQDFLAKSDNDNLFKARVGPCSGGVDSIKAEDAQIEEK